MAEIETNTSHAARMTPGGRGQFDVVVDGDLVFSKQARGRFPEDGEVLGLLASATGD